MISSKSQVLLVCSSLLLLVAAQMQIEARRLGGSSQTRLALCEGYECELSPQHYALYSSVKRAIVSHLDIKAKEIYPLLNSIELLKIRFESQPELNGSSLVRDLLADPLLGQILNVLRSEDGKSLIDIYRAPVNGKDQNLACNRFKLADIERAAAKLNSSPELASIFRNIHKNFVRKAAKKCLVKSCNSIDLSMSQLDYMLGKYRAPIEIQPPTADPIFDVQSSSASSISDTSTSASTISASGQLEGETSDQRRREFAGQELELCRFFKRTNEPNCSISGKELREVGLLLTQALKPAKQLEVEGITSAASIDSTKSSDFPAELIKSYVELNIRPRSSGNETTNNSSSEGLQIILEQCRPMQKLLDHNLAALRWYEKQNQQNHDKLSSQLSWCPKLSYWYHMDKVCSQLEQFAREQQQSRVNQGTFAY